jgi:uncharacterized protein (TIGR02246 family)
LLEVEMGVQGRAFACAAAIVFAGGVMLVARRSEARTRTALAADAGRQEIDAFNQKFIAAQLRMDNAAVMSLWAEDGVSLLPQTAPLMGKAAIGKFLDEVIAKMPGYRVEKMEVDFQGIEVRGDWASEWTFEHHVVRPLDDRPAFDGRGKMLLVLHRQADGNWRIEREMWDQGTKEEIK